MACYRPDKKVYKSVGSALEALRSVRRKGNHRTIGLYPCKDHGGWHLGNGGEKSRIPPNAVLDNLVRMAGWLVHGDGPDFTKGEAADATALTLTAAANMLVQAEEDKSSLRILRSQDIKSRTLEDLAKEKRELAARVKDLEDKKMWHKQELARMNKAHFENLQYAKALEEELNNLPNWVRKAFSWLKGSAGKSVRTNG